MKLSEHVENIRQKIDTSFRNLLGRMGITDSGVQNEGHVPEVYLKDRNRILNIREVLIAETGNVHEAYEKLVEEFTFTLFNRLAALKVMEAHTLHPEIVTRRSQHGDRSFAHKHWLEQNPDARNDEMEGLVRFLKDQFSVLATDIPLFSLQHPFHLIPTAIELTNIISSFNKVETDDQVEDDIWMSDDVLGWLYESYNNFKKAKHKESGAKTEFNKVSIQSQVYTPRWVVKFLVDNSLGKLYLEMFPDSGIKARYKIANAPAKRSRDPKPLTEIRMIDPATGSGNFLLYGFDLFYELYLDQIENFGADYDERKIPELIITYNLHGVDLDDRAIQLAQLGLYIKAKRKKRSAKIDHFNIVSSDFYLPDYDQVKDIFEENNNFDRKQKEIISSIWEDLQNAYKFGSLIRLEEKLSVQLHGVTQGFESIQLNIFSEQTLANYENFKNVFFSNLHTAISQNTIKQGMTFLNTKAQDAITFLQIISQKYDVAVANPPYTDSSDFGPELKMFVETNYRQPYKFNSNLYASFIKRCCEITDEIGFVALIHPHTFMFIKTFDDVRKYIIEHTHIDLLVDYGLDRVNLFGPGILLDATWYVLSKKKRQTEGVYFNITANQQEKAKKTSLEIAYDDYIHKRKNDRVYNLLQEKLKIIDGWPFIYWISDGFREKFKGKLIKDVFKVAEGLTTADNNRFLRFFWEIENDNLDEWPYYAKGGSYNKYYGNVWLRINWKGNGKEIKEKSGASVRNERFYFKDGITFSSVGTKGVNFRVLNSNCLFDSASRSVFPQSDRDIFYGLGLLNSSLALYTAYCLNPTVSTTVGDIERLPYIKPPQLIEDNISALVAQNIAIKKALNANYIIEINYCKSPIFTYSGATLQVRLLSFLNYVNAQITLGLINEALINQLIFDVYDLSEEDRQQVESKMGKPVVELGIGKYELQMFREAIRGDKSGVTNLGLLEKHLESLPVIEFDEQVKKEIVAEFQALYQGNNNLEEFCIRNQVNPINIWYWFIESKIVPQGRAAEIALEFLADAFRTILMTDEDGIIPLVGLPNEPRLMDCLEQHCFKQGFSPAQFMQLDSLIGRPINEYIEQHFFKNLSDHLNLFPNLPKTPFIWHLSSGEHQGFEAFIIIYKWNQDSLYKLKSSYLTKRTESLQYRLQQISDSTSAQSQTEKETIRLQLQEIEVFAKKIDELISEGYNPKLDDGVGKNIAPLQKKGMLRAEVLNKKQLEKYLNADW
jgi:hypothetical protein